MAREGPHNRPEVRIRRAFIVIEAAWSTSRELGAITVALATLVLFITEPAVLLDTPWNASFAAIWLVTTLVTAWAVAAGRLSWWPVNVLTASIAAQSHEFLFVPAMVVCVGAACVGLVGELAQREPRRIRWIVWGALVGIACWLAPVVQQLTNNPGNLTLLWRAAHRHVETLGVTRALEAFSSVTHPYPYCFHSVPVHTSNLSNFVYADASFDRSSSWTIVVMALLVVVGSVLWLTRRRALAGLAAVALLGGLTTVVMLAALPVSNLGSLLYMGIWARSWHASAWPRGSRCCGLLSCSCGCSWPA